MAATTEKIIKVDIALFTVLTPIEHDGKYYQEGDTLSLPDGKGDQLLEIGAIELQ